MEQKHDKNIKNNYSFKDILTGSDLSVRRLAIMEHKSEKAGPVVWITAAIHGDEVGGIAVVHEVFKQLRSHPLTHGSVHAMPLMNPAGFEASVRHIPVSDEDLNRSFPGNPRGKLSERIAATIFETITSTKPTLVIDLHNDWRKTIPYLLLDPFHSHTYKETYEKTTEFARKTGLVIIEEHIRDEEMLKKTLSGSMMQAHVPAFTLELGESYVVNERDVKNGVAAIWNVLLSLHMVDQIEGRTLGIKYPPQVQNKILTYSDVPHSQSSGLIRFLVRPGEFIEPGAPLVRIYDVFGKLHETVHAEHSGVVIGCTDAAMAYPGMPLVALGVL